MRHELDWRSVRRPGTVWFSHGGSMWLRRTWDGHVERVAMDDHPRNGRAS